MSGLEEGRRKDRRKDASESTVHWYVSMEKQVEWEDNVFIGGRYNGVEKGMGEGGGGHWSFKMLDVYFTRKRGVKL